MSMLSVGIVLTLLLCSPIAGNTRSCKIGLSCRRSGRYPPPYMSAHADDVLFNVISNVRYFSPHAFRSPIWRTTAMVRCRCHPRPNFRVPGLLLSARGISKNTCVFMLSRGPAYPIQGTAVSTHFWRLLMSTPLFFSSSSFHCLLVGGKCRKSPWLQPSTACLLLDVSAIASDGETSTTPGSIAVNRRNRRFPVWRPR